MNEQASKTGRNIVGQVVNKKANKTIVVGVATKVCHPKYGKYMMHHRKYSAHDENNQAVVGDSVLISEVRPFSKTKSWKLVEIVGKAQAE